MLAAALALEVAVLTMTPGGPVFARFGHTALRISDTNGDDRVYNFGAFRGDDPELSRKFLERRIEYFLNVSEWHAFLRRYADRTITGQVLALGDDEAARLRARLDELAQPDRRAYRYDWFRTNCTTRTRDVVDEAAGGALQTQLAAVGTRTIRDTLRDSLWTLPSLFLAFSLGLNQRVDEPLSGWDAIIMPADLMNALRHVEHAGRPLVAREWQLEMPLSRPRRESPWLLPLLEGALLALLAAGALVRGRAMRLAGGVGLAAWGLAAGLVGWWCVAWTFLPYPDAGSSANVIAYSPLALVLAPVGIAHAVGRLGERWRRRARVLVAVVAAGALAEWAGHAVGLGRQHHAAHTAFALAAWGLSWGALRRAGRA